MLIRVISDVHGNGTALDAVMQSRPGADADVTLCLGDVVGYGAEPSACIRTVRESCELAVLGNHDAGVTGRESLEFFNSAGAAAVRWTREALSPDEAGWLESLPPEADAHGLHLCHAYPPDPLSWTYVLTRAAAVEACRRSPDKLSLIGHTHMPGCWRPGGGYVETVSGKLEDVCLINAGSVGQPRDGDPRAAYLLLDTERGTWRHVRVEYDIEAAASAIMDAGLPPVLADRLFVGR